MQNKILANDRYLRITEVCGLVRYSRQHIYYLMQRDLFPRRIKFGAGRIVWSEKAILNWIEEKINNSNTN